MRDGPGPASNGTAKESCQLSVHTHTYIHIENTTYVVGIVHEEKPVPTLKAASVFTFFFFFSTPWKNNLPLLHPQDEDGGDTGRRWCPHLHWCPHATSPVSPGLSPHQGLAPFRLGCSHCKVRLPYLLGFSSGGESFGVGCSGTGLLC